METPIYRICKRCHEELELDAFVKNPKSRFGRSYICSYCHNQAYRQYNRLLREARKHQVLPTPEKIAANLVLLKKDYEQRLYTYCHTKPQENTIIKRIIRAQLPNRKQNNGWLGKKHREESKKKLVLRTVLHKQVSATHNMVLLGLPMVIRTKK